MTEQLMDVLCAVHEALDIPEGASARAARIRSQAVAARAEKVVPLLHACIAGGDLAGAMAELRTWLEHNPVGYVTVEQAGKGLADRPTSDDGPTYVEPGCVLALPRAGLPAWVGSSYLARLWRVHPRTVAKWADDGLLICAWQGAARRFSREAVLDFARDAIPVRLLQPGMVVQHPQWADGMPVCVVSMEPVERLLFRVSYHIQGEVASSRELEAAPPAQGTRLVLRYPIRKATP